MKITSRASLASVKKLNASTFVYSFWHDGEVPWLVSSLGLEPSRHVSHDKPRRLFVLPVSPCDATSEEKNQLH